MTDWTGISGVVVDWAGTDLVRISMRLACACARYGGLVLRGLRTSVLSWYACVVSGGIGRTVHVHVHVARAVGGCLGAVGVRLWGRGGKKR